MERENNRRQGLFHLSGTHSENSLVEEDARKIVSYTIESVLPESALRRVVSIDRTKEVLTVAGRQYYLNQYDRIFLVGGGKAAKRTARALIDLLGERITAGVLNVYREQAEEHLSDRIRLYGADHPIPNEKGVEGAKEMIRLLESADEKTLVIALISGGGSSLMAIPVEGVSLEDYKEVTRMLLSVPATIDEINAVRKHIDRLKGGRMRKLARCAGGFISLVVSDVPVTKSGKVDDPSVISSGPTVGDGSTFETAKNVLIHYGLWGRIPFSVRRYIESGIENHELETLGEGSPILSPDKNQYVIVGNNDLAMEAARQKAEDLGYAVRLIGWRTGRAEDKIKGEVGEEVGKVIEIIKPVVCETDLVTFVSFSTDGIDGNSNLAGAIAHTNTLDLGKSKGMDYLKYLENYDSATYFKKLGLGIETGTTGTNVADICLVFITNPNNPYRKMAFVFGGEPTVSIRLPEGKKPGSGGRNTHMVLLAAERLAGLSRPRTLSRSEIAKGLIEEGIPRSRIEIGEAGIVGYSCDVGPIKMKPMAVVGTRNHSDVEKVLRFVQKKSVPVTARGAGSGLPAQSVGFGVILDMRSMDRVEVLSDHPMGGKVVFAEAGAICSRVNQLLKSHGVFLASYPASHEMSTIGGMIVNNASGANSCKLGTTKDHVVDLRVVLHNGTSVWTSDIDSETDPWKGILELIRLNEEAIKRDFPRVPKNSSGYNVVDLLRQIQAGIPVDWSRLFAHSEGTLGIITEAKLRALPLPTQKATCIVYFTDIREACAAIPEIYALGPSCFDTAITTNLEMIRKAFPALGIREDAKVMYLIEFDDLEVRPDPADPSKRIGQVRVIDKKQGSELIESQVDELRKLLEQRYGGSAVGFEVARDPARQEALWIGRRNALQVLYGYDPAKRPLTMIECVVLPRDGRKILDFINTMEEVFHREGVIAGTHGHAGDCNFHLYLLLNLGIQQDREKLIRVMTDITRKVIELGGSMSGEHADGRTRGVILPHVFGLRLFDLFVQMKERMDPGMILHPGVKIVKMARGKALSRAIEEVVGVKEEESKLDLTRFRDFSKAFRGTCSFCSQCAEICPVFRKLSDLFAARSEAAPLFKRVIAMSLEVDPSLDAIKKDPLYEKMYDLCLLCGQCTFKCPTGASIRDVIRKVRGEKRRRWLGPVLFFLVSKSNLFGTMACLAATIQGVWRNRLSRRVLSLLPEKFIFTRLPRERYLPELSKSSIGNRWGYILKQGLSEADIAYFYGCSARAFSEPIVESFLNIARHNGWKVAIPPQVCCGEPFAAWGYEKESIELARYNIDKLSGYRYIVAHCPSCIYGLKECVADFVRIGDSIYEEKARTIAKKLYDPAQFMIEVVGRSNIRTPLREIPKKVAVHLSCHEKLGRKITSSVDHTREILKLIPGLELVEMQGAEECCGLGGPWGLLSHYDLTLRLREEKIENIIRSGTDLVSSWCFGCILQIRDGLAKEGSDIQATHPLELLSEAYGPYN